MSNESVSFYTFGCRLNQSETAVIERTFEAEGFHIVDYKKPADVVVINTCTVTENGDADTRRLVNRINRINPHARIALIGCQAQIQKKKLAALANVRWVVGNANKMEFLSILKADRRPKQTRVITPSIPKDSFTVGTAGIDHKHTRANIKIQDGCDFFCSFCEIPYARGRARSRKFEDILLEARALSAAGHKELVVTGINVGTYQYSKKTFPDVIDALEQVEGLKRIRISSIEPTTISQALIKKMAQKTKLCRHLHIPLQSGNERMLKSMKRKYTAQQFHEFINQVYTSVPDICIGTDVIVGFPGETDDCFRETADRLREWPVHYFHVFSYSQRHLAKSQHFPGAVSARSISERSGQLRALSTRKRIQFFRSLMNSKQKVIFEQKKNGVWTGLTDNYIRVNVTSDKNLHNQCLNVRLGEQNGSTVSAELDE